MSEGQIRMTAAQYRTAMGLDPVTPEKTKVTVKHQKKDKPLGESFNRGMSQLFVRLLWLAGWAWMLFTFGWIGHVIVKATERILKDGS